MNLELLDHHYREAESRAYENYRDARRRQKLEYSRGLLTPEEYRELSAEVERLEDTYYDAQVSHALIVVRYLRATRPGVIRSAQLLTRVLHRIAQLHRVIETPRAKAENLYAPPLTRLAHSISTHGPPSFTDTYSARLSVLTT